MFKKLVAVTATVAALVTITACSGSSGSSTTSEGGITQVTIAEPVHGVGYLPLYAAIDKGYFEDEGIEVSMTTLTGGGHVNALLTNEVFGFIGGPESGAVANVKGADLVTVANVVNRGNVYIVAATGQEPAPGEDLGEYLEGKRIVGGRYGGTPSAILRHILIDNGLDPEKDVTLSELDDSSAIPSVVSSGQADVAVVSEPQLGAGIDEGIWGEPFVNALDLLGPYAYSSIVVQQKTIDDDPETVEGFVKALEKGQADIESDPAYALELAQREFPTMDVATIQSMLDRAYADELWGGTYLDEDAVETALQVARDGEVLKDEDNPQSFDTVATNEFVTDPS